MYARSPGAGKAQEGAEGNGVELSLRSRGIELGSDHGPGVAGNGRHRGPRLASVRHASEGCRAVFCVARWFALSPSRSSVLPSPSPSLSLPLTISLFLPLLDPLAPSLAHTVCKVNSPSRRRSGAGWPRPPGRSHACRTHEHTGAANAQARGAPQGSNPANAAAGSTQAAGWSALRLGGTEKPKRSLPLSKQRVPRA